MYTNKCCNNKGWSSSKPQWLFQILTFIFLVSINSSNSTNNLNYSNTSNFIFSSSVNTNTHRILSSFSNKKQSNLKRIEASLAQARATIMKGTNESIDDPDYVPLGSVYRNPNSFHR